MNPSDHCALEHTLLNVDQALEAIKAAVPPIEAVEKVPLKAAGSRILAMDIRSPADVPRFRNSAVDGYALNSADLTAAGCSHLSVCGTSRAGQPYSGSLQPGCCVRIFTGALLPDGADTVIMQEQVERHGDRILPPASLQPDQNVRLPGEEFKRGQSVLSRGTQLGPADIGVLASLGFYDIPVIRKPRVAFFANGDELRPVSEDLGPGQIHDSNRYLLQNLLAREAIAIRDMGVIGDDDTALQEALEQAAPRSDAIITTGGASVGDADLVRAAVSRVGMVALWRIAMKPGKPLIFGKIGKTLFFGLPGNPVSVATTYTLLVRPGLHRLMGAADTVPLRLRARCLHDLRKSPGRQEFQRGILSRTGNTDWSVASAGPQGSHLLSVYGRANCFIILPAANQGVRTGDWVEVQPFEVDL